MRHAFRTRLLNRNAFYWLATRPQSRALWAWGPLVLAALAWGAAGSAVSYVLEAGSSSGASNVLTMNVGVARSLGGPVGPGTYYARVRGVGACGQLGPASNQVTVVVQ